MLNILTVKLEGFRGFSRFESKDGTNRSTYAWGDPVSQASIVLGWGHVPGSPTSMSSTRAELCGIFAAITHLRLVIQHCHVVLPKGFSCNFSAIAKQLYNASTT